MARIFVEILIKPQPISASYPQAGFRCFVARELVSLSEALCRKYIDKFHPACSYGMFIQRKKEQAENPLKSKRT
jgi:hypothetical protein